MGSYRKAGNPLGILGGVMEGLAVALDCCVECVVLVELVSVLGEVLVFGLKKEKTQLSKWSCLIYTKGGSRERPLIMRSGSKD